MAARKQLVQQTYQVMDALVKQSYDHMNARHTVCIVPQSQSLSTFRMKNEAQAKHVQGYLPLGQKMQSHPGLDCNLVVPLFQHFAMLSM